MVFRFVAFFFIRLLCRKLLKNFIVEEYCIICVPEKSVYLKGDQKESKVVDSYQLFQSTSDRQPFNPGVSNLHPT